MRNSVRGQVDPFIVMDVMEAARLAEESGRHVIHMEVGQPSVGAPKCAREALAAALDGVRIAYFSGITLAILPEPGRALLIEALSAARAAGTQVVFDPNLRPRLWSDNPTMRRDIETAAGIADLVLPSFDDEREHFGDADPQATVERYLARGAGQVVVKAGGDAIRHGGREGWGLVDGLTRERPVDTTAAGDSFNAGYLAARLAGKDIGAAIREAHELSRRVIRHRGALVREALARD